MKIKFNTIMEVKTKGQISRSIKLFATIKIPLSFGIIRIIGGNLSHSDQGSRPFRRFNL